MSSARRYEIRLFDQTLVEFSIEDGGFAPEAVLEDYDAKAQALMPCGLAPSSEGIWRWHSTPSYATSTGT